jgi:hypothetical protein
MAANANLTVSLGGERLVVPSGDTTGATDWANIGGALAAASGPMAVTLIPGTYYINQAIALPTGCALAGSGKGTTVIQAATSGLTMVELASTATTGVTIRDLTLSGASLAAHAISLNDSTVTADAQHLIANVFAETCTSDNVVIGSLVRETRLENVISYYSGGNGFTIQASATDNKFVACTAGANIGNGFNIAGNNSLFTACKAFYSGYNGSSWTAVDGWFISGAGGTLQAVSLVGCESQANGRHGFVVYGSTGTTRNVTLAGCVADSNGGAGSANAPVGFQVSAATYVALSGCQANNNTGQPGTQLYAVQLSAPVTGTTITGCVLNGATTAPILLSGSPAGYRVAASPPASDV